MIAYRVLVNGRFTFMLADRYTRRDSGLVSFNLERLGASLVLDRVNGDLFRDDTTTVIVV